MSSQKLEIARIIEYTLPSSVCCVEVRRTYTHQGEERSKMISCHVRLNHDYADGRFVPKSPEYYQKANFRIPVCSTIPNSDIGSFVTQELTKRFQEQRQKEGW
jgi:hypothetical protein